MTLGRRHVVGSLAFIALTIMVIVPVEVSAYHIHKINWFLRRKLKMGRGKRLREQVVERYFDGVQRQDRDQIMTCFPEKGEGTKIRDVCGLSRSERIATADELAERCMEFLAAHPDTKVKFHYPPTCGRGKSNRWVFAHWYEEGTWKGISQDIKPNFSPLEVEGQTRFYVDDDLKIREMVITRTFSEWEKNLQTRRQTKAEELIAENK